MNGNITSTNSGEITSTTEITNDGNVKIEKITLSEITNYYRTSTEVRRNGKITLKMILLRLLMMAMLLLQ